MAYRKVLTEGASNIWRPDLLGMWEDVLQSHEEQAQIVLLLAMAPNITNMVAHIWEPAIFAITSLLGTADKINGGSKSPIHGFERLERLCYYSRDATEYEIWNDIEFDDDEGASPFALILQPLKAFPRLQHY